MNQTSTRHPIKSWLKHVPFFLGAMLWSLPLWPVWEHWRGAWSNSSISFPRARNFFATAHCALNLLR